MHRPRLPAATSKGPRTLTYPLACSLKVKDGELHRALNHQARDDVGPKRGLGPSDPGAREKSPSISIRVARPHRGWHGLPCTLDYMKCKTLGARGRPLKGNGAGGGWGNHTGKRIRLTALSLMSETSEDVCVWRRCGCRGRGAGGAGLCLQSYSVS